MNFDEAFHRVLGHEGEYSDHAADPGGATRWGITEKVARENGYTGDMRTLPVEVAKAIYRRRYWDACQCDQLPGRVAFHVFDAAVNSGPKQAALWLQRAVGAKADGIIGAKTIAAARGVDAAEVAARISGRRLEFITGLKHWGSFGRGWARRIAENLLEV